jgi:hypothetical protein
MKKSTENCGNGVPDELPTIYQRVDVQQRPAVVRRERKSKVQHQIEQINNAPSEEMIDPNGQRIIREVYAPPTGTHYVGTNYVRDREIVTQVRHTTLPTAAEALPAQSQAHKIQPCQSGTTNVTKHRRKNESVSHHHGTQANKRRSRKPSRSRKPKRASSEAFVTGVPTPQAQAERSTTYVPEYSCVAIGSYNVSKKRDSNIG